MSKGLVGELRAYAREVRQARPPSATQTWGEVADNLTRAADRIEELERHEGKFWIVLREPGRVPERKGPWPHTETAKVLREFIAARPTAYIDVLTWGYDGPDVQHGPEALQMLDGRSMSVGRKHNARTAEAHSRPVEGASAVAPDLGVAAVLAHLVMTGEATPTQRAELAAFLGLEVPSAPTEPASHDANGAGGAQTEDAVRDASHSIGGSEQQNPTPGEVEPTPEEKTRSEQGR